MKIARFLIPQKMYVPYIQRRKSMVGNEEKKLTKQALKEKEEISK